jgi:hypothetical protein
MVELISYMRMHAQGAFWIAVNSNRWLLCTLYIEVYMRSRAAAMRPFALASHTNASLPTRRCRCRLTTTKFRSSHPPVPTARANAASGSDTGRPVSAHVPSHARYSFSNVSFNGDVHGSSTKTAWCRPTRYNRTVACDACIANEG